MEHAYSPRPPVVRRLRRWHVRSVPMHWNEVMVLLNTGYFAGRQWVLYMDGRAIPYPLPDEVKRDLIRCSSSILSNTRRGAAA